MWATDPITIPELEGPIRMPRDAMWALSEGLSLEGGDRVLALALEDEVYEERKLML